MANNTYVNKVQYGNTTLIDLTADTVTAASLAQGYTAHDASGAPITGTASGGSMVIRDEADSHGGTIRHITAGSVVQGTLSITQNGSYDVAAYADAEVSVPSSGVDIPQFEVVWYDDWSAVKEVTCNMTYAECQAFSTAGNGDGRASVVERDESMTDVSYYSALLVSYEGQGYLLYTAGTAYYDIRYNPNGTIQYIQQSSQRGAEGTPAATKGTVSNHAVSVTPSVTNTRGFISGGTHAGTPVTVSASELVSGNLPITANGTGIDVTNYATVSVDVPSGGSSEGGNMSDPIRFFDYDGTLVASYSAVPASLPSVPTHAGLTNGTWNYTLAQITTQFNAMGTCDVGANYDTVSGATEIDIELPPERLHPYLTLAVNGTVTIDWGDNSTSTSTGTSLTTRKTDIHHEYAAAGSYTIKITKTSGTGYSLYCTSVYSILSKNSPTSAVNRGYSNCVQSVRVGTDCTIGNYAFNSCYSLVSVSIPGSITSIGTYAFYNCYSLAFVTIPSGVTSVGNYAFNYCYSLVSVSIPSGVTTIGAYVFQACYSLASVSIPSGVTTIGNYAFNNCCSLASVSIPSGVTSVGTYAFNNCYSFASVTIPSGVTSIAANVFYACYSLASVTIPSGVTSIAANAFYNCYGMTEYHFKPTTPPTLANTNAFTNIQSDCVIYVPASKLNDYKTAENWSTYADYMVGE